ncbi:ergothioneine biosynthesis protein EgtB [Halopseudomonas xiamenensis]|uniref:ergothioneine biosynthesis protein EgtB n=1 Tax=Halopseudomonas xiamenensis TaxID=157792 RepID=UPI001629B323|nr:ergothioneine biosynthesis protein EgtB [Halopseudomonas xiamenensis]
MTLQPPPAEASVLQSRYHSVRDYSMQLIEGLSAEDCQLQSMAEASPIKWHLAHTSWFFETFILSALPTPPARFDDAFAVLFNSYYVGIGPRHARPERGMLSRPSLDQILAYRQHVDTHMREALSSPDFPQAMLALVELGLNHEQQHQELILTDLKHHFSRNPLSPAWRDTGPDQAVTGHGRLLAEPVAFAGGLVEIGHAGNGFHYDNEGPRHRVWLEPFQLASRNVNNGEYLAFIRDGGYQRPELWLSDGWDQVCAEGWQAPLYWQHSDSGWQVFTLHGLQPLATDASLSHVSFYEADAYARWADARLPTEAEWEHAATQGGLLHGLFDEVWQWCNSAYLPYPGFRPAAGAVGEYNGKFMINQMVLRGGSLATPARHSRASYRNFFPAGARWQFSGVRLAWDGRAA